MKPIKELEATITRQQKTIEHLRSRILEGIAQQEVDHQRRQSVDLDNGDLRDLLGVIVNPDRDWMSGEVYKQVLAALDELEAAREVVKASKALRTKAGSWIRLGATLSAYDETTGGGE